MFPVVPSSVKYQKGFKIFSVNVLYWADNLFLFY